MVEQIGQQPDHFAAVDLVLDHAQDNMPRCRPLLPGQVHPGQVGPIRQVLDRPGGHAGPRPDQQMGPGPGIHAPQGDSGEAPVHDHEHSRGRGGEPDRQLRFAAAGPVHGRVDLRVGSGLGQRHRFGAGGIFRVLRTRRMVEALTRWPSLSSSPWIRW